MLEAKKIYQYFEKYPSLRVLFFFDADESQRNEFDGLELEGVRKLVYENNPFNLKVKLNGEWLAEKVLLYLPQAAPAKQEEYRAFPLLDLLVANKELKPGDVTDFLEEHGLQNTDRALAEEFMRELKYSNVQQVIQPILKAGHFERNQLIKGLLSAFMRFNRIQNWDILMARLLCYALPDQTDDLARVQKKIQQNQLLPVLEQRLKAYFPLSEFNLEPETLTQLVQQLKYNLITQRLGQAKADDPYRHLKIDDTSKLAALQAMAENANLHPKLNRLFQQTLHEIGLVIQEEKILTAYGPDADYAYMPEALQWAILKKVIHDTSVQPETVLKQLTALSLQNQVSPALATVQQFFSHLALFYQYLRQVKKVVLDTPEEYVHIYVNDWHRIDQAYRKAITLFGEIDTTQLPTEFSLDEYKDQLNEQYDSFVERSNREWVNCLKEKAFDYSRLQLPKQYDFFQREIKGYEHKVAVIISDALRYEAAAELLSVMHGDTKNEADIKFQLASIPSKTSVGMANLLGGKALVYDEDRITVDGISTSGTENRQKILQQQEPDAIAITYNDLQNKSQEENREVFKHKLVYVYHDVIDATGDSRKSENRTFRAVAETLSDLDALVRKLHGSYNVARVIVTADHGFLYTDRNLEDKDLEDLDKSHVIQSHNRYALLSSSEHNGLGHVFPLKNTTKFEDEVYVKIPASTNRYKKQGVGHRYVHMGASLQELVVPLIESTRNRYIIEQKVRPLLVTKTLSIASNTLIFNLLQENKVSRTEKEVTLIAGIYRDTELASTQQEIMLNSVADLPTERTHRVTLTLLESAGTDSVLNLKIFDKEDMLNPLIDEKVINNTLITTDF